MLKYYVITFDTTSNYTTPFYVKDLSLSDAISNYFEVMKKFDNHINVMLGVSYSDGSVDILQRIDGKIKISKDYKYFSINEDVEFLEAIEKIKTEFNLK